MAEDQGRAFVRCYGAVQVFGTSYTSSDQAMRAHGLVPCGLRHFLDEANGDRARATELVILCSHMWRARCEDNARTKALKKPKAPKPPPIECTCLARCSVCQRLCVHAIKDKESYIARLGPLSIVICSDACRRRRQAESNKAYRQSGVHRADKKHSHRARRYGVAYVSGISARTVAKRDKMTCQICKRKVIPATGVYHPRMWSVGHIVAMAQGGAHVWSNVQCECITCNTSKGTKAKGQLCMPFAP